MDDLSTLWLALRARRVALRSRPVLKENAPRRQTFSAALAQFEEQMTAAKVVSPATRPINLYYALAQAGMAISALHAPDQWSFSRHGLKLGDMRPDLADIQVGPDGDGGFQRVTSATGSPTISGPVRLGVLWDSLPEMRWVDLTDAPRRVALDLLPDASSLRGSLFIPSDRLAQGPDVRSRILELLSHYPGAEGASIPEEWDAIEPPEQEGQQWRISLAWPSPWPGRELLENEVTEFFDGFAPEDRYRDERYLRPSVEADGKMPPSPLMTWWLLLYSLSMLARYQPRKWTALLDLDGPLGAVSVQFALESALAEIPHLVLNALDRQGVLLRRPLRL